MVPDERLAALDSVVHADQIVPTDDRVRRHRGPRSRRVEGRRARQPIPRRTSARSNAIVQVARCFEDANVVHVENRVDPVGDIATVTTELCLKDLDTVQKRLDRARKSAKGNDAAREARGRDLRGAREAPRRRKARAHREAARKRRRDADRARDAAPHREADVLRRERRRGLARRARQEHALPEAHRVRGEGERARRSRLRGPRRADRAARSQGPPRIPRERRPQGAGPLRGDTCRIQALGAAHVLHRGQTRSARVDDRDRREGSASCRRDPHRLRKRLHQSRSHLVGRLRPARRRSEVPRSRQARDRRQGVRHARRRRRCTSGSTSECSSARSFLSRFSSSRTGT